MADHDRPSTERPIRLARSPAPRSWRDELEKTLKVLAAIGLVFGAGLTAAAALGFGGVSAADFAEHAHASETKHKEIDELRLGMTHIHEEQRATREDFRAVFPRLDSARPLPEPHPLSVQTPATLPSPDPTLTGTPTP